MVRYCDTPVSAVRRLHFKWNKLLLGFYYNYFLETTNHLSNLKKCTKQVYIFNNIRSFEAENLDRVCLYHCILSILQNYTHLPEENTCGFVNIHDSVVCNQFSRLNQVCNHVTSCPLMLIFVAASMPVCVLRYDWMHYPVGRPCL
jgi:hypothetical protein